MRYLLYTLLFLLSSVNYAAGQQNLVPNGDFEDSLACPMMSQTSAPYITAFLSGWSRSGSPDYFHTCSTPQLYGIPSNIFGYQHAASGVAYAGFVAASSLNNTKEFLTRQIMPMQPGKVYAVSMSVSHADSSPIVSNNLGIHFFDTNYFQNYITTALSPSISFSSNGIMYEDKKWVRLCAAFMADSSYDNILIGGFGPGTMLDTVLPIKSTNERAYYYVDSVVVRELDSFYVMFCGSELCVQDTIRVEYGSIRKFNTNNIFTVQLSDSAGLFTNPLNIGTKVSDTSGYILCTIPDSIPSGTSYRVRVIASDSPDTTQDNGCNILINNSIPTKPFSNSNSPLCVGDTLYLAAYLGIPNLTWNWRGPNGFESSSDSITRVNISLADSGYYFVNAEFNGCVSESDTIVVVVHDKLQSLTANSNAPVCESDTLSLFAPNTTPSGASYSWTGPNNFTSNLQNPVLSSTTSAASGSYIVTADRLGCKVADTITVTVKPLPTFTATSNAPLCTGNTMQLGINSSFTGVSYSWAGPSGFNASIPNPFISSAISANGGDYIATATLNGCTYKDTTTVLIKPLPAKPLATNNSPFCQGDTVYLTSTTATSGVSYSWTGPGSFSDTVQNSFVYPASSSVSGDYIVTVTKDNCISKDTTTVTVKPRPDTITLSNNSPLCHGDTLKLFSDSSSSGVSYTWTGPGSFSSSANDTIIANAAPAASGWYHMTVDLNGCTYSDSTLATIHPIPSAPSLNYNNPLCLGETLNLSANTVSGGAYSWSGPGNFNTSAQNPPRINMQYNDTGAYYATVTVNGCTSLADSIRVAINPLPFVVITANPSDSVCQGSPATFTAYPNNHGGTPQYQWYVNNQLAGTNPVLITTTLNDRDIILCRMTDNTKCAAPYTDESNDITMTVLPWLVPSVSITANPNRPLKPWEYVTFTATAINAGNSPGYQWKRNGVDVVGATGSVWSANTLNDNDSVSVEIVSNYKCPQPPAALSNGIIVQVLTGIGSINTSAITLYPNPNTGKFVLEGNIFYNGAVQLEVSNAIGQVVYTGELVTENHTIHKEMELNHPTPGIYFLKIKTADGTGIIRFTVR